jgi:CubicO group peptidase (beta-lactamase class C family)
VKRVLRIFAGVVIVLAVAFAAFLVWAYRPVPEFQPFAYEPAPPAEWPIQAWPHLTPEAQGMSSETLLAMAEHVKDKAASDPEFFLDSITVIRNGHIVAEVYPNPNYPPDRLHVLHSATKSIISALIGIAIEEGFIDSVDVPLVDIFPDREIQNLDARKEALTIRDLLSMQTGLHSRDSYLYGYEGLFALQQSDDWLQFVLDLPMAADPGARFDYSNISTFLLGAVLAETTGTDVLSFAREVLFDPLGIDDVRWEWAQDGLPIAWARMWLKPNDLAKIGLLYLQKGRWDGRQIIPEAWIEDSVTPQAYPKNAVDILNADMTRNRSASSANWVAQRFVRFFANGYGYQWWLDRGGAYSALGTNGQFLIVAPEHNLIVVATSKSSGMAQFEPAKLFYDYVLPSVQSDTNLPENEVAHAELAAFASPPARPVGSVVPVTRPEIANAISGTTFLMEKNPYNTDNLRFVFSDDMSDAAVSYTAREDQTVRYSIGLDGVSRLTENDTGAYVAHGYWTAPDTLEIEVEIVGYTTFDRWEFRFGADSLSVTEHSITGTYIYAGRPASP